MLETVWLNLEPRGIFEIQSPGIDQRIRQVSVKEKKIKK